MEFPFDCEKILQISPNSDHIAILDQQQYAKLNHPTYSSSMSFYQRNLMDIIDKMGQASSKAQGLGGVITTAQKFFQGEGQRLYVKAEGNKVMGILKMQQRNLFIRSVAGAFTEIKPLCVLDFYVHESVQRSGIGKELFEKMLEHERKGPEELGYDRPSPKLLGFLRKHYGLTSYSPQNNNFVVYDQYFTGKQGEKRSNLKNKKEENQFVNDKKQAFIDKWSSPQKFTENRSQAGGYDRIDSGKSHEKFVSPQKGDQNAYGKTQQNFFGKEEMKSNYNFKDKNLSTITDWSMGGASKRMDQENQNQWGKQQNHQDIQKQTSQTQSAWQFSKSQYPPQQDNSKKPKENTTSSQYGRFLF